MFRRELRTNPMTPETPETGSAGILRGSIGAAGAAIRTALEAALAEPVPQLPGCPTIPDHVLLHRIGTGAYGDVWLARSALGSLRAIKVVYRERFDEERPYQREFHGILKYEPVSRTHEGLVAILHVGRNDQAGYFYYVMELADPVGTDPCFVPGTSPPLNSVNLAKPNSRTGICYAPRTLRAELAGRRPLSPVEGAGLTLQLAKALEHLHNHGLVHRDIKPSNVIFVEGRAKLADIGLVTAAGDSRSFVGTEGFIPPEGPGTVGADLYGLGKLLYELATGRDRMDFPQLLPDLHKLPGGEALLELNEVITQACAPDPRRRYTTAAELAADLRLFLAGHSLRKARQRERNLAFFKRVAIAACLLVLLTGLALWFARREAQQARVREQESRQRAEAESALRRRAEAAEHQAQQELYVALVEQARTAVRSGEMGHRTQALDALRRAAGISNSVELRREALRALSLPDLRFERQYPTSSDTTLLQLDPGFERMAVCRGAGPVEIRSASEDRVLTNLPATANLRAYVGRWSPDGRFLAVKRDREDFPEHADLEVWEVSAARLVLLLHNTPHGTFSFNPQRPFFTAALAERFLETWDLESGNSVGRVKLDHDPILISIAPDGQRLAQYFEQEQRPTVSINLLTNAQLLASHSFADGIDWIEWHPSGNWLAVPDFSGLVHLLDTSTGGTRSLGRHKAQAVFAAFSPNGDYLLTGGWERELICWNVRTTDRAFNINLNSFLAQFRSDGQACAIMNDKGIRLHTFELPSCHRDFPEDLGGRLLRGTFSPDARWFAASGKERLGLWDLTKGGPAALISEGGDAQVCFSGDSRQLFASRAANCLGWRIGAATQAGLSPRLEKVALNNPENCSSLTVVSNIIAFTTAAGSQVISLDALALSQKWAPTIAGINGLSPNGRWLGVYRPYTSMLYMYELPLLTPVAALNNGSKFNGFQFSPLGDEVAVACPKQIEFWSTANWQRTHEITNFMGIVYSPDGRALWLTRDYQSAGLYNARTLEPLLPLPSGMLPLAISPDGRFLALGIDAHRLQIWDLEAVHKEFRKIGIDWNSSTLAGPL